MESTAPSWDWGYLILIAIPVALALLVLIVVPIKHRIALAFTVGGCILGSLVITWATHTFLNDLPEGTPSAVASEWLGHVATALVAAAVLEVFFHVWTLQHLNHEWHTALSDVVDDWRSSLTNVLRAEPNSLLGILRANAGRRQLLQLTLKAETNEERGDLLYQKLLEPYLQQDLRFRNDFHYSVQVESLFTNTPTGKAWAALLAPDRATDYYLVCEDLRYSSTQGITNPDGKVEVRLVFEVEELETTFRRRDVFFREFLQISEACREQLRQLDVGALNKAITELFRFRVRDSRGRTLRIDASWGESDNGTPAAFVKIVASPVDTGPIAACRIDFTMPQIKTKPYFVMQINEPTRNPTMIFSHEDDDAEVADFPFFPVPFDRSVAPMGDPPRRVDITIPDNWVFPRSGLFFVWRHVPAAPAEPEPPVLKV